MKRKRLLLLLGCAFMTLLSSCGQNKEPSAQTQIKAVSEEIAIEESAHGAEATTGDIESSEDSLGSVPYFQDDTGKLVQKRDGYLYGYWGGKLCRYDEETLERTVLFETTSPQSAAFCFYEGYVYFTQRDRVTSLTGKDITLYRVKCDGTDLTVLAENLPNPNQDMRDLDDYYEMDIYDDILYLLNNTGNLYFQIEESGTVISISEEETLYGKLPAGYSVQAYYEAPSLPYCMRNYGYFFAQNSDGNLARINPENGQEEKIELLSGYDKYNLYFTNNYILYQRYEDEAERWYFYDLTDTKESLTTVDLECDRSSVIGYDETGVYYQIWIGEENIACKVDNDGNVIPLITAQNIRVSSSPFVTGYSEDRYCVKDEYLYYYDEAGTGASVFRVNLENKTLEMIDTYYDELPFTITNVEKRNEIIDVGESHNIELFANKIQIIGNTPAVEKINQFLKDVYKEMDEELQRAKDYLLECEQNGEMKREGVEGPSSYVETDARIIYIDENYICISAYYDYMRYMSNHGMYWTDYYVFDRKTGERLALSDFVENSEEEIGKIVNIYAKAQGFSDLELETILEQDRFYLTEAGIGIHYDVYELGAWASGSTDFVIPYYEFEIMEKTPEVKVVYDNPSTDYGYIENVDDDVFVEDVRVCSIRLKEFYLKEEVDSTGKINQYLEELYTGIEKEAEEVKEFCIEEGTAWIGRNDSNPPGGYCNLNAYISYMDERYICITVDYDQYWFYAPHNLPSFNYYVFNRVTGEELHITDIVENTTDGILELLAPQIEEWQCDVPKPDSLMEPGRFGLTNEGIIIEYDVYEIGPYPMGNVVFEVPYDEMKLR